MNTAVVVAYATKAGSTKDVAEAVARRLREHGRVADVRPVGEVGTLAPYGAVVVVNPARLRFPFNRMPASDARDWDAIGAWADAVAATLTPVVA